MSQNNSNSSSAPRSQRLYSNNRISGFFNSQSQQNFEVPPPPYQYLQPTYYGDINNPNDDDQIANENSPSNEHNSSSNGEPILNVGLSSEYKTVSSIKPQKLLCMASLITNEYDAGSTSTHADIVLVLDISGSMNGSKIDLLKESLYFIISELSPKNRLSLVTFNTSAHLITPLLFVNDSNKRIFSDAIKGLIANGGTDIGNGLKLGLDILSQRKTKNSIAGMILLSDGMDNYDNSYEHLYERAREATISIHNFGYGSDHDASKLHTIAERTGGSFTYIYEFEQVKECFAGCIGGLVSISCCDIKLYLRIPEATLNVAITEVLSKYENIISDNGLTAQVNISDLYAGEKKDILFMVNIQATEMGAGVKEIEIIKADISYFDIHKGLRAKCLESPVTLKISQVSHEINPSEYPADSRVVQQKFRHLTSNAISEAMSIAEQGDYNKARTVITDMKKKIEPHHEEAPEFYYALMEDLDRIAGQLRNSQTYHHGGGRAYSLQQSMAHQRQRSWGSRTNSESGYQTNTIRRYSIRGTLFSSY